MFPTLDVELRPGFGLGAFELGKNLLHVIQCSV